MMYQPPAYYLPHTPPMLLLEKVIEVGQNTACSQVRVSPDGVLAPFLLPDGRLPAWFGIELIAQTVGIWAGWHKKQIEPDKEPDLGLLLGIRAAKTTQEYFPAGATLTIMTELILQDESIGSFEGKIMIEEKPIMTARLTTYQPTPEQLYRLFNSSH